MQRRLLWAGTPNPAGAQAGRQAGGGLGGTDVTQAAPLIRAHGLEVGHYNPKVQRGVVLVAAGVEVNTGLCNNKKGVMSVPTDWGLGARPAPTTPLSPFCCAHLHQDLHALQKVTGDGQVERREALPVARGC